MDSKVALGQVDLHKIVETRPHAALVAKLSAFVQHLVMQSAALGVVALRIAQTTRQMKRMNGARQVALRASDQPCSLQHLPCLRQPTRLPECATLLTQRPQLPRKAGARRAGTRGGSWCGNLVSWPAWSPASPESSRRSSAPFSSSLLTWPCRQWRGAVTAWLARGADWS